MTPSLAVRCHNFQASNDGGRTYTTGYDLEAWNVNTGTAPKQCGSVPPRFVMRDQPRPLTDRPSIYRYGCFPGNLDTCEVRCLYVRSVCSGVWRPMPGSHSPVFLTCFCAERQHWPFGEDYWQTAGARLPSEVMDVLAGPLSARLSSPAQSPSLHLSACSSFTETSRLKPVCSLSG